MKIWDISLPVTPGLPVWPGDPPIALERYMVISEGDAANVLRLTCSVHTGTHVDAPVHFLEGRPAAEELPLNVLIGPAVVAELLGVDAITPGCLEALVFPPDTTRLLVKTGNSQLWADPHHEFYPDYVVLTPQAAEWVVRIRLLGVDYLSVQRFSDPERLTHRLLLEAGVVIVEGLDLREVPSGCYQRICLPMKLVSSDGAPARAVLIGE